MSANDINQGGTTKIQPMAIIEMATKLFPEYYQLEDFENRMEQLQFERAKFFREKLVSTNTFTRKVVESNQLRCEILRFENEQKARVQVIRDQAQDALSRIEEAQSARIKTTVLKGMPLIENDSRMRWEVDTNNGECDASQGEYDLAISKAKRTLEELHDRFNYETMINATLISAMGDFVIEAELPQHESALWIPKQESDPRCKLFPELTEDQLLASKEEAFEWMRAAATHFAETEHRVSRDEAFGVSIFANAWDTPFPQDANFCDGCKKHGHTEWNCEGLFLEKNSDFCYHCNEFGHIEETCWVLHQR